MRVLQRHHCHEVLNWRVKKSKRKHNEEGQGRMPTRKTTAAIKTQGHGSLKGNSCTLDKQKKKNKVR